MKSITKISLLLFISLLVFSSCCTEQNAEKPKNAISYKYAKALQQEYIVTRADTLNKILNSEGRIKGQDVRDVTFGLEEMKQYIAYVEKEAAKKGLKGLGLRVYLGTYSKEDKNVKTPGYTTVFFMPTHQPKAEESNTNNFFFWHHDEIIGGVDGFNMGQSGIPPNDLK